MAYLLKRIFNHLLIIKICLFNQLKVAHTETLCPSDITAHGIVKSSAAGVWYLTYGPRIGDLSERNTCGFFNTMWPCKCIGVNIESDMSPPFISKYSLSNYGYHERYEAYASSRIELNIISKTNSIFNAFVPLANLNFTIAVIGTDEFRSWIIFTMCDELVDKDGKSAGKITWIISRNYEMEESTLTEVFDSALFHGSVCKEYFFKVNQTDCPANNNIEYYNSKISRSRIESTKKCDSGRDIIEIDSLYDYDNES